MKFVCFLVVKVLLVPLLALPSVSALPSTDVVILQVQTGGVGNGTASQELLLLYNTSAEDVNITDWCVQYSSAANGVDFSNIVCIDSGSEVVELWLSAG